MDSEIFETTESFIKNYEELKKSYRTSNILTKYEKTKILSERCQQLNNGSISYIKDIQSDNIYEIANQELKKKIINKIIEPTLNALKINKSEYVGFLYAGLMIKNNEPYLIEFNVRMGDPECQTILPRLKSNLLKLIIACCKKKLKNFKIKWHRKKSLSIVLCSKGYPGLFKKNIEIKNLNLKSKAFISTIYHAGTFYKDNKYYSNGGRVLNFVHTSNSFKKIRNQIISEIRYLDWKNGFYRKDIGYRVIK